MKESDKDTSMDVAHCLFQHQAVPVGAPDLAVAVDCLRLHQSLVFIAKLGFDVHQLIV